MSNLVLIRTLRDSTDPDVRKPLQKMLILECVRNKDRMAVEPIVRLLKKTRVSRYFEQGVTCGTLKLVLDKYRFSKSNQQGVLPSYTAISYRPLGSVLALDYEFKVPLKRNFFLDLSHCWYTKHEMNNDFRQKNFFVHFLSQNHARRTVAHG